MPHVQLQSYVSFAFVEDRAVFLDLRRDRYFVLDGVAAIAFDAVCREAGHALDAETAARLVATGLFMTAAKPAELIPVNVLSAERELPAGSAKSFPPIDLIEIGWLVRQMRCALVSQPIEKLIEGCRRTSHQCSARASTDKVVTLAKQFRRVRAWVPITPSCLQDSFALHRWLGRRRVSADLIIGVKLNPFAAHCWLQLDRMVLNDAPERVAAFSPILTVRCN